jgi:hypothetical protein
VSTSAQDLLSIVYSSTAAHPYDDEDLGALLALSRDNNAKYGLTGMLLYRRGRFLQVLEGPEDMVRRRMSIIAADPEHTDVRILLQETTDERQFPDWTMGYEPVTESMADDVPGFRTTFSDLERDEDPTRALQALRELVRWFQDQAVQLR